MADENQFPEWLDVARVITAKIDTGIQAKFGVRVGLLVFAFDFNAQACGYVSNADRDDTVTMLIEWLERQDPERLAQAIVRWREQKRIPETAEPS